MKFRSFWHYLFYWTLWGVILAAVVVFLWWSILALLTIALEIST